MFASLAAKVPADKDLPARAHTLDVLSRVLNGTLYDILEYSFQDERTGAGEYVKLSDRRPSARYNLSRIVVEDSISLLFGEGRFPTLATENEELRTALSAIVKDTKLNAVMACAALIGSVGSAVVWLRVLKGRLFIEPLSTAYLTPAYDPSEPDMLLSVTELRKVRGDALRAAGYTIADDRLQTDHWFKVVWDAVAETFYVPWPVSDPKAADKVDAGRTTRHGLGFVPMVWIHNLPGGVGVDGACTFRPAIETQIEIEYQLSQAGRGLKYSSDPTLLIKEPSGDTPRIGGAANALIVAADGDARMIEINGTASAAVIEYVRTLREMALETVHGNRSSADKISAAQSGRAIELLHQPLIQLADKLRISYGEDALTRLIRMIVAASAKFPLMVGGVVYKNLSTAPVALRWPDWFSQTQGDLQQQAGTLATLRTAGMISRETAVAVIAPNYDIEDPADEIALIIADEAAADARESAQIAAQTKITETAPG